MLGMKNKRVFSYVGMDIASVSGVVQVHQHSYIENLQQHLQAARAVQRDAPLNEAEKEQLRPKIGQILWGC